jgi:hypothetical protein
VSLIGGDCSAREGIKERLLGRERKFADDIEEQGSAVGVIELASARCVTADERVGPGSAAHGDEGL